ncbi:MAG TPA: cupin domain-containing protein [Candidatus Aminicenantes bacterium]|nr:cupin domain-containing protein [Candidatus Aminicenantes bacterium]
MTCQQKAINLITQLQYQKGSIVSQEIYKQPTGTLTLFAFDEGQGLSEHTAPFDAFIYCLEGQVEVSLKGHPHQLKSGDLLLMPANLPHALHALSSTKILLIMFRTT